MLVDFIVFTLANMALVMFAGLASGSRKFLSLMALYGLVLSVGGMLSLAGWLARSTDGVPFLGGSDGEGYYLQAVLLTERGFFDFQDSIRSNYFGYQLYLALWFSIFGASLTVGIIANNALLVLSVLALYRATVLLSSSPRAALLACLAFMLTTAHIYHALLLLKEPALGLAFALILLAAAEALRGRAPAFRAAFYFAVAVFIIITMRGTLLLFLVVLLVFVGGLLLRRNFHVFAAFLTLLLLMAPQAANFTTYELDFAFVVDTVTENTVIASKFAEGEVDVGGVVGRVSEFYLGLSFIPRVLLFIVPVGLQFFIPFDFWNSAFHKGDFSMMFSRNLNLLWFMFIGIWALFSAAHFRQIGDEALRRFLLAGVFSYALIAAMYGGAIPRYAAPSLLFVYPAIGYFWDRSRMDPAIRNRALNFFKRYYMGLGIAVIVYLYFQLQRLS